MDMKSRAELLMDVYSGILADVLSAYPEGKLDWIRDESRLQSVVKRGELWFFTITLPSWSKIFSRSLDEQRIQTFDGPHSRFKKGRQYPRLFSGLFSRVFDEEGLLRVDADIAAIRFLNVLLCVGKKIRMTCNDKAVIDAVQSFVEVEESVRHYTLNWGSDLLVHDPGLSIVGDGAKPSGNEERPLFQLYNGADRSLLPHFGAIQSVADQVFSSFGSPFWQLEPHHGPGAISDKGHTGSKYQFPNWPEKLERCFPSSEFGVPNFRFWIQPVDGKTLRFKDQTVPSKLIAVPKTQKAPRLIASEPSANMWMQQAVRRFMEDATDKSAIRHSIDFRNQAYSGQLALKSSLDKSHSTIDLSDASDRLSCWLIERLFRRNRDLLDAFNAVRTDMISIRKSRDLPVPKNCPKLIKLKKFSTQGSALTFPTQTLVFTVIAIGTILADRGEKVNRGNIERVSREVRVFGDDIIVPNAYTDSVIESLHGLGLKVNLTKTFSKGNFRESCGVDGFKGQDITPAYVLEPFDKSRPTSVASVVECANNFYKKRLFHASSALQRTLPEAVLRSIASIGADSGAFGLISPVGFLEEFYKCRFNKKLQVREALVLSLDARAPKVKFEGDFALHQYFTEHPDPTSKWENGEARRPTPSMRRRWVQIERFA